MKFFLLILTFLITSCSIVRVYDIKDLNKNLKKNFRKLDQVSNQMNQDIESKKEFLAQMRQREIPANIVNYSKLDQGLVDLKNQRQAFVQKQKLTYKKYLAFKLRKKKKISDDLKDFPLLAKYEKSYERDMKALDKITNGYNKQSDKFNAIINAAKIYKIISVDLKTNTEKSKTLFQNSLKKSHKQVRKTEKKLRSKKYRIENPKAKRKLIAKMKQDLSRINLVKEQLYQYIDELYSEVKNHEEVWVTPGMHSFQYIARVNEYRTKLQKEIDTLNKHAKEFNKSE